MSICIAFFLVFCALSLKCENSFFDYDDPLKETCQLIRKTDDDYGIMYHNNQFHAHADYGLVVLYSLNQTASRIKEFWEKEIEGYLPPKPSQNRINETNWKENLGLMPNNVSMWYSDYLDFYRKEIQKNGVDFVLINFGIHLMNGICSGLFHPMIQLGFSFELKNEAVFVDKEMMASGFAWLSAGFYQFPELSVQPRYFPSNVDDFLQILSAINHDSDIIRCKGYKEGWQACYNLLVANYSKIISNYDIGVGVAADQRSISEAIHKICVLIFMNQGNNNFFSLHLVTGSRAFKTIVKNMPEDIDVLSFQYLWRTIVYVYIASGAGEVRIPTIDPNLPSWNILIQNGTKYNDVHLNKLIYLGKESGDDLFHQMVWNAVQWIQNGNDWKFDP